MTVNDFENCIGRYGSVIETWPESVRSAAQTLVAEQPQAARLLGQARRLDRLFAMDTYPPPPAVATILAYATTARPSVRSRFAAALDPDRAGFSWLHAGGLAACLLAGVIIGSAMTVLHDDMSLALLDFGVGGETGFAAHADASYE